MTGRAASGWPAVADVAGAVGGSMKTLRRTEWLSWLGGAAELVATPISADGQITVGAGVSAANGAERAASVEGELVAAVVVVVVDDIG